MNGVYGMEPGNLSCHQGVKGRWKKGRGCYFRNTNDEGEVEWARKLLRGRVGGMNGGYKGHRRKEGMKE